MQVKQTIVRLKKQNKSIREYIHSTNGQFYYSKNNENTFSAQSKQNNDFIQQLVSSASA